MRRLRFAANRQRAKDRWSFEQAQQRGVAVVSLGSKWWTCVVQRALKLVARAKAWPGVMLGVKERDVVCSVVDFRFEELMTNELNWAQRSTTRAQLVNNSRRFLPGRGQYSLGAATRRDRSSKDYPENGDSSRGHGNALRKCGLRDGMVISTSPLRDGDQVL